MIPEMEFIDIHGYFTHGLTLRISVSLVLGVSNKMACIIIQDSRNLVGKAGEVFKNNTVNLAYTLRAVELIPKANDATGKGPQEYPNSVPSLSLVPGFPCVACIFLYNTSQIPIFIGNFEPVLAKPFSTFASPPT